MGEVRVLRNNKLMESDWTQVADSPLDEMWRMFWAEYRQDLRDVPDTNSDVTDLDQVIWPAQPS